MKGFTSFAASCRLERWNVGIRQGTGEQVIIPLWGMSVPKSDQILISPYNYITPESNIKVTGIKEMTAYL